MSSLQKIPVQKLFKLSNAQFNEYHNLLKHLDPKPIKGKPINSLTDLSFGEVASVRINLSEPSYDNMIEIYKTIFGLTQKQIQNIDVVQFFHSLNWIRKEISDISKREVSKLISKPDAKLKEAGIDELNIFGELNTLIALGEKFGTTPQEVEKWNYNLVFSLMLHQKITSDVNKRYLEITKPQK